MQEIRSALKQIALSDVPVLVRGESGVGKEVVARQIHSVSARAQKPFLKINCAALPLELLESELFGYEQGAFTGAMKRTLGKFEVADGGTILLDEIGDMDFRLQAKLLHVLQDSEFQRLGGREMVKVDVRVLAATHCDLQTAIREKRFREDLYYRLDVVSIEVPPLRERKDEILPLAELFLEKHASAGVRIPEISEELKDLLLAYSWPGNVRELENVIRRLLVFGDSAAASEEMRRKTGIAAPVAPAVCPSGNGRPGGSVLDQFEDSRKQMEVQAILDALNRASWNRKRAAALLKMAYKRFLYRIKVLGIVAMIENLAGAYHNTESAAILDALAKTQWNRRKAAALLDLEYHSLLYKMKTFGIGRKNGGGEGTSGSRPGSERSLRIAPAERKPRKPDDLSKAPPAGTKWLNGRERALAASEGNLTGVRG